MFRNVSQPLHSLTVSVWWVKLLTPMSGLVVWLVVFLYVCWLVDRGEGCVSQFLNLIIISQCSLFHRGCWLQHTYWYSHDVCCIHTVLTSMQSCCLDWYISSSFFHHTKSGWMNLFSALFEFKTDVFHVRLNHRSLRWSTVIWEEIAHLVMMSQNQGVNCFQFGEIVWNMSTLSQKK